MTLRPFVALVAALLAGLCPGPARAADALPGTPVPTGFFITPAAAPGAVFEPLNPGLPDLPDFTADHAVAAVPSPDGTTLLVLTAGYNQNNDRNGSRVEAWSREYVFVYDVTGVRPVKRQVLKLPNAFAGLAWRPDGREFYASGGVDDTVVVFRRDDTGFAQAGKPVRLGHRRGLGRNAPPMTGGIGVTADGRRLVVANFQNDSVTLVDTESRRILAELDLRPGRNDPKQRGVPGGEFPLAVAVLKSELAFVASVRDREVVVVALAGDVPRVAGRIALAGQPTALALAADGQRLFVAEDNSDRLTVIDVATRAVLGSVVLDVPGGPSPRFGRGSIPNGLALAPGGATVYVTCAGLNALAVADVSEPRRLRVRGFVPTGHYPTAVAVSGGGKRLHVVNAKSPAGPAPGACFALPSGTPVPTIPCSANNQYVWQLKKAGFLTLPVPADDVLATLTAQVAANANLAARRTEAAENTLQFLRAKIRHVIYVVKENRTYDQVFGDIAGANGEPKLCILPEPLSPNHHRIAKGFVLFDNFLVSGETSNMGWNWATAAFASDYAERTGVVNYAGRGMQYDHDGYTRDVPVALDFEARRKHDRDYPDDRDLLPGPADVAAPDGPGGEPGAGYIWDAALRAKLTLRNYGFFTHNVGKAVRDAFARKKVQAEATKAALVPYTDPYFRSFDQEYADFWRLAEWEREFDGYVKQGALPQLELVWINHDHFGNFATAADGVDTVETQMADNDYALGRMLERLARSPFRDDTLVFVTEDDAQSGPDHVDAQRSLALIAGPYVRHGAVVSKRFTTVSLVRTILAILGVRPLGLFDGAADPMVEAFDPAQKEWTYTAIVPEVLRTTKLPLPAKTAENSLADTPERRAFAVPRHDAAWWAAATAGQDFDEVDDLDETAFARTLMEGLAPAE